MLAWFIACVVLPAVQPFNPKISVGVKAVIIKYMLVHVYVRKYLMRGTVTRFVNTFFESLQIRIWKIDYVLKTLKS